MHNRRDFLRTALGAGALQGAALLAGIRDARAASSWVKDVRFRDLDGRITTLAQYASRAVVVHAFTTWDLLCLRSVAELRMLAQTRAKDVAVVGVGMDMEGALALRPFQKTLEPGYPVWVAEPEFRAGNTAFGPVRTVPAFFIVGPGGRLGEAYAGYVPLDQLTPMVNRALR
jgi:hypothetical protein